MRDIIRATPLASGTFYNYFKSKEEVFQAIQDELALAIRPRLRDERRKARTVEEFISSTFRTFLEFMAEDHTTVRTIRHSADTTRFRVHTPEIVAGFEELREDIEKAIQDGLFPPIDADFLMASIVGVAFEVGERMVQREKRDPVAAANFATALFIGGIRTLPNADRPRRRDGHGVKAILCRALRRRHRRADARRRRPAAAGRGPGAGAHPRRGGELPRHPDRPGQVSAQARSALHPRHRSRRRRRRGG